MIKRIKYALQGRSPKWHSVRESHLMVQPRCRACSTSKHLEVHHIEPFDLKPELELDRANLITLCNKCHLIFGHFGSWRMYNPNVILDVNSYLLRKSLEAKKIG